MRQPCCDKQTVKKGPWAAEEDLKLINFINSNSNFCWRTLPNLAGLRRCGKSCRLRWINYLRPGLKRGLLNDAEEEIVITSHARFGNRWSKIAALLPGRTDNDVKNHWNTHIKKKLLKMGIDPATHKPLPRVPIDSDGSDPLLSVHCGGDGSDPPISACSDKSLSVERNSSDSACSSNHQCLKDGSVQPLITEEDSTWDFLSVWEDEKSKLELPMLDNRPSSSFYHYCLNECEYGNHDCFGDFDFVSIMGMNTRFY